MTMVPMVAAIVATMATRLINYVGDDDADDDDYDADDEDDDDDNDDDDDEMTMILTMTMTTVTMNKIFWFDSARRSVINDSAN